MDIDLLLGFGPVLIVLIGIIYYARKKMKKDGVIYVLVYYTKWFFGVAFTMFAFYIMMISGDFFKEHGYSVVFSLPIATLVWFVPMHFSTKFFTHLEKKYKKSPNL